MNYKMQGATIKIPSVSFYSIALNPVILIFIFILLKFFACWSSIGIETCSDCEKYKFCERENLLFWQWIL